MKLLTAKIISIYASDTAGISSALYELGGMCVVHDASGCNSTYSTHDEPRWFGVDSMIYISALTEKDAVMGNDQKFVNDVVNAARELKPEFIALSSSPLAVMVGTDMDALAELIQQATNIPAFYVKSNGINSYLDGMSGAFLKLAKLFLPPELPAVKRPRGVNILGATPLDFTFAEDVESIKNFLQKHDFEVVSSWAMGSNLDEIKQAAAAEVNLVVSAGGLALAQYFYKQYQIPYVTGVPVGSTAAESLAAALEEALKSKNNINWSAARSSALPPERCYTICAESIYAGSLAQALAMENSTPCRVVTMLPAAPELLAKCDKAIECENEAMTEFARSYGVIADNLFMPIVPDNVRRINLPHEAFSGRCFHREHQNLIDKKIQWEQFLC